MTSPKKYVFVIMPFKDEFKNIYECAIKPALSEVGTFCQRLDEMIFVENMLGKIYNEINKADFIVADLSTQNPNVFYELGYAHALNKKVLLLTSNPSDIPFDLKQYQHCIYNPKNLIELKNKIVERVGCLLDSPNEHEYLEIPFQFRISNSELLKGNIYKVVFNKKRTQNSIHFDVEVFNNNKQYHDLGKNKVYLSIDSAIMDKEFQHNAIDELGRITLPMENIPPLFPLERFTLTTSLGYTNDGRIQNYLNKTYNAELRIHLVSNVILIPFRIELVNNN